VQPRGRSREAPLLRHGEKHFELEEVHQSPGKAKNLTRINTDRSTDFKNNRDFQGTPERDPLQVRAPKARRYTSLGRP
jgi:hypothetical protein